MTQRCPNAGKNARSPQGVLIAGALVLAAGCAPSPFTQKELDEGERTPHSLVRQVKPLDAPSRALSTQTLPDEPPVERRPDPFAGLERVPATIEQCRAWAIANNLDLRATLIEPVIAEEGVNREEARFESVFTTSASYGTFDQPTDSELSGSQFETLQVTPGVRVPMRTGGEASVSLPLSREETDNTFSTLNPSYESDVQLSLSQPLLRGAGRRASVYPVRIAALDSDIVQARANLEVIRLLSDVEKGYWNLYAAVQSLEVRQREYELADQQLARAQRRVTAGQSAEIEVTRARSGLAQRLEAIIVAENEARNQQRALLRLLNIDGLGVGSDKVLEIASQPDPVRYVFSGPDVASFAVGNRMEMLELELQLLRDRETIDFEKNRSLPLFTFEYTYNINGLGSSLTQATTQARRNQFADHIFGANFEVPLGNEEAESAVHQAILARLQRLATKASRAQQIELEVYTVLDQMESAWQRIVAARQSALLAAATLAAEQRQFDAGTRTSTDVLDAATQFSNAQLAEIQALTSYQIAMVDLAFATGTTLGAAKVEWSPVDPRGPGDFVGERRTPAPPDPSQEP